LLVLSVCVLLALIGCSGGSSALSIAPKTNPQQTPDATSPDAVVQTARNALNVRLPELSRLAVGAQFDVILSAQFKTGLFQGSGRLAYDSRVVQPVSAIRGALLNDNLFVAKLDTHPANSTAAGGLDGVVPFAFTGLPGSPGFTPDSAELLRVRFKLLAVPAASYPVALINDPQYLQLRNPQGQRLSFDLNTEVVSK
jgi:hypothetical protein